MDTQKILLDVARKCFEFISPKLNNYSEFSSELTKVVKVKELENIQYSFDVELDNLIKKELSSISAKIFSEESGWYETSPNYEYKISYDPFCNSSLASKGFREAAMGISLFSKDNEWQMSLVLDYQTGLIGFAKKDATTTFFQAQNLVEVKIDKKNISTLPEAWAVVTLESIKEREGIKYLTDLLAKVGRLIISSGHIYWLKLAMGVINVYTDPIVGEELYEMFAATIAQGAGCKVTDLVGNDFDPSKMFTEFENNRHFVYKPVTASNDLLHTELMSLLPESV